jgi:hypothetical protein
MRRMALRAEIEAVSVSLQQEDTSVSDSFESLLGRKILPRYELLIVSPLALAQSRIGLLSRLITLPASRT